ISVRTFAASTAVKLNFFLKRILHQSDSVEYASKRICAFEGSTVEISCTYTYPPWISYKKTVVQREFWFTKLKDKNPLDLREDPDYAGRVTYHFSEKNQSSLTISDLTDSDADEYRCKTTWWGRDFPGTTLTVVGLQLSSVCSVIMEGSSVTLTCSCDANPAAKFRWYKNNQTLLLEDQSLILRSVQRSDSRKFHCVAENKLGEAASDYVFINVEYPPETSSVSVSPSAEVLEGSSVTLTCSSDANPAANYTWFKDNRPLLSEDKVHFSSIRSEHSGNYSCKSENKHGQSSSTPLLLDVQYPPRIPSVSVFGKISKGSSVTLTCSSDANPAANFSWFKKDEDSPKASGPNWTISDLRAEHSGFYYCEAENRRGSLNSSLHLIEAETGWFFQKCVSADVISMISQWGRCEFVDLLVLQLNTSPDINSPSAETEAAEEQLELHYSSIHFSKNQEEFGFKKSAEAKK
uniref:Ig-like domain-containing protein n=1 Tax=Oryzias latipes TaxID=8090 RepID=A0A3B3HNP9_ORYLA